MADILPYLGVEQKFSEEEIRSKTIVLEDMTGLTGSEAEKLLKERSLTAQLIGTGETVTGQIPAAGESVPGGSEILLYLGEAVSRQEVEVPDFSGMNRAQAEQAAGKLGLYIQATGNSELSPAVTVTEQSIPPKTKTAIGTTVTLKFTDTGARD